MDARDVMKDSLRRMLFGKVPEGAIAVLGATARSTGSPGVVEERASTWLERSDFSAEPFGLGLGWTTVLANRRWYRSERELVVAVPLDMRPDAKEAVANELRLIVESEVVVDLNALTEWDTEGSVRLLTHSNFYDALVQDLRDARRSALILGPFVGNRIGQLHPVLIDARRRGVEIILLVRPSYDSENRQHLLDPLREAGIEVRHRSNRMHEKLAVIDSAIAYHGSLNPLSHRNTTESILRFACPAVAASFELQYHPEAGQAFAERVEILIENGTRQTVREAWGDVPDWWKADVRD